MTNRSRTRLTPMLTRVAVLAILVSGCFGAAMSQSTFGLAYQLSHVDTGEPFPAPDGKHVVYESKIEGVYQLFTMDTDGSHSVQITHDHANHDIPSWSPDGKWIAFMSDRSGHEQIHIIHPDGSGETALTGDDMEAIHPTWSPDSAKVIFCTDDDMHPPKKNASEIYTVELANRRLTKVLSGGTNTYPAYSPDGKQLAFRKMLGEMNSEVFVANADGTDAKNISNHPAFDGWPSWSPDGKLIAFSSNRRSNYQVFVMYPDGSNVRLVANTEGRGIEPRFSADGKTLYFTNCRKVDFGTDCQIFAAPVPK
jgi:TolB protein